MPLFCGEKRMEKKEKKPSTAIIFVACLVVIFLFVATFVVVQDWLKSKPLTPSTPEYALHVELNDYGTYPDYLWGPRFVIDAKITNTGQKDIYVSYLDFYIITDDNELMEPVYHEDRLVSVDLKPGTWTSGKVAFDVPATTPFKVVFHNEGFWREDIHLEWTMPSAFFMVNGKYACMHKFGFGFGIKF